MIAEGSELSVLSLDLFASSDVETHRMVSLAGAYPAPGGLAFGATTAPMGAGRMGTVSVYGLALVQAGEPFAKDVPLMCGADGTAIAHDGSGSKFPIGRSVSDAQAGDVVSVWLIPCAGLPVSAP